MNSKKIMKIVTILMIIATIVCTASVVLGAAAIPSGDSAAVPQISPATQRVIGIVQYICYAAAVILLVYLGVKFMTASPEGKAEIKKSAIIYVVGAALVFAAGLILGIIFNTTNIIFK